VKILKDELEARFQKNRHYSLRAFARDIGVAPSRLSDALTGRAGFSSAVADQIAKKLGFGKEERDYFCALVEVKHARSQSMRKAAAEKLESLDKNASAAPDYRNIQMDAFKVVSDWYHFAILELSTLDTFDSDPADIAKRLGISKFEAEQAIDRLLRLELLERKKGKLIATDAQTASPSGVPSDSIKKFHTQVLGKAIQALQNQGVDERDFSTVFFTLDRSRLPEAKERLKKFRRSFTKEFSNSGKKESVYCLSTQLFDLTNAPSEKRNPS